ncbi:MAG: hypothetical protein R6U63_13780 [Longimicrobiales bacterium]
MTSRNYQHAGRAGCVQLRKAHQTGTMIGVYRNDQAGLDDDDGRLPWSTVCEDHGWIVSHPTLGQARRHAPDPLGWCEDCREATR